MKAPLRLLIIEDVEDHALLIVRELQKGGVDPVFERVETLQEVGAALDKRSWDAVICDFNLPGFDGLDALRLMQEKGVDIPFLLVSGAIGEEKAAEVMKAGAHDFIKKGNYARLVVALERELREVSVRRERRQSAEELTRYREGLEDLVRERTEELVRTNEALQAEIAERRRAEEALRNSEERLRFAALAADIGMWHYDLVHNELTWSDRCKALFGYPPEFPVDYHSFLQAVHEDDRSRVDEAVQTALRERSEYAVEMRVVHSGGVRWVMSKGHGFYDHQGEPVRMHGIAFDITQRKKAEEEIARLNRDLAARVSELEERNQELDAFNRMVSHDLRQPLNTIGLASQQLQMLCSPDMDEQCKKAISVACQGVRRMNSLIETLLKFAGSTHRELQCEHFDLAAVARKTMEEARQTEPQRRVIFRCPERLPAYGDPDLLRTVLENLLGNAWKYSGYREEAVIELGGMDVDGAHAYFVRDNGKGFDMADAGDLFVPFKRLRNTEEFKGFGIGLATVERIIRRHGGRIWAEGEPDKGATFYFTLGCGP